MTQKKRVKADLTNLTSEELGKRAVLHGEKMEGNANFPNPDPKPGELKTQGEKLLAKIKEQADLEKQAAEKKAEVEKEHQITFNMVSNAHKYVDLVADGDEQIILSAAMSSSEERQATTELSRVKNVSLQENGASGNLVVNFAAVKGAKSYVIEINLDVNDENGWSINSVSSSTRNVMLKGLKSGIKYWVRVKALGPRNIDSPYSQPVSKIVQ